MLSDTQLHPLPRPPTPTNESTTEAVDEEALLNNNSSEETQNATFPGVGEFQEIIDRHSQYMEISTVPKPTRTTVVAPVESQNNAPVEQHVVPISEEVYVNTVEPEYTLGDITDVDYSTEGWYSTFIMIAAIVAIILSFMSLKQLGIHPIDMLKIFPFMWIMACVILCAIMYMGYRIEQLNKTRINHERLVRVLNLPRSMPCLLPGNHDLHGCQDEPWSEPCLGLPPRLPTYASSLDCARPKQEENMPPPYECDYDRPPSILASPPAYEDANHVTDR